MTANERGMIVRSAAAAALALSSCLFGGLATAAEAAEGSGEFPPFDSSTFASQLLWLVLTFGLFYYLMAKVALPRISDILETRSDRIAQDMDEAHRLKEESDAAIAAYEQELAEARNRAHAIAQEARDASKAEADAQRATLESELAEKIADAEASIAKVREAAMKEVGSIAEDTTSAIVSELVGGRITKAEIASAVKEARG
ncbi:MAG: F0F1 ATP synthase subunit B [Ahrensia sp.]|nr:F0F1 ATP synthase subunit B [Ahrensia sp.]